MTFLLECGADKSVFQTSLCSAWIHNDFIYVRFGGIRNTKTWSKFRCGLEITELIFNPDKTEFILMMEPETP